MKTLRALSIFFLGLCLCSLAWAQSGMTLLVRTDATCNWKLDGRPMGLLKADDPKIVLVSQGEHVIEAAASEGVATLRTRVTVDKVEKTVDIQLKGRNDQQTKIEPAKTIKEPSTADAANNPTWTDPATGLTWTARDNGSDVDWPQADAYCSDLTYAGFRGWRLPTMEELQGIYDPGVTVKMLVDSKYPVDGHVKGNLNLTGLTWSAHPRDNPGKPYETAWFFEFGSRPPANDIGTPLSNFLHFSWSMRALCVRQSAPQ